MVCHQIHLQPVGQADLVPDRSVEAGLLSAGQTQQPCLGHRLRLMSPSGGSIEGSGGNTLDGGTACTRLTQQQTATDAAEAASVSMLSPHCRGRATPAPCLQGGRCWHWPADLSVLPERALPPGPRSMLLVSATGPCWLLEPDIEADIMTGGADRQAEACKFGEPASCVALD